jgi:hypothetical protein
LKLDVVIHAPIHGPPGSLPEFVRIGLYFEHQTLLLSDNDYQGTLQECVDSFYADRRKKYFSNRTDPLAVIKVTKEAGITTHFMVRTDISSQYGALLDARKFERVQVYVHVYRPIRGDEPAANYSPGDVRVADFDRFDQRTKDDNYRPLRLDEQSALETFLRDFSNDTSVCIIRKKT